MAPASGTSSEAEISKELVRRIQAGDRAAEAEFIERFQPRLRYVLRRELHNPADLEDVIQSTLLVTLERLRDSGIAEPEKLGGFVNGVAYNLKQERFRDNKKHNPGFDPDAAQLVSDPGPGPAAVSEREQMLATIRELMSELEEERDREVLIRLYFLHQTTDEICTELDIDRDHFRKVLYRAKDRLKKLVGKRENLRV